MRERGARDADIMHALAHAATAHPADRGCWRVDGQDPDGDELTVVAAIADGVVVVTVFWEDERMKCVQCGSARLKQATEKHHVGVAKIRFWARLPVTLCPKCGESYMDHDVLARFERAVAQHLAETGPATGETFRFMRKATGLPAKEAAALLSTTPETVSRWETGSRPMDRNAWTTLSALVLDELGGKHEMRERLRKLDTKPPKKTKPVRVDLEATSAR
jgi:putative zinc finger/helix-turn-helix YgiT family protein